MNLEEALECADMWTKFKKPRANSRGLSAAAAVLAAEVRRLQADDYDPTPYCGACGSMTKQHCKCGPIADNE